MTVLLSGSQAVRAFEKAEGLLSVASLYRANTTPIDVKKHAANLISMYLLPENGCQGQSTSATGGMGSARAMRSTPMPPGAGNITVIKIRSASDNEAVIAQTKTVEEKRAAVSVCFDDVDELPAPFWMAHSI